MAWRSGWSLPRPSWPHCRSGMAAMASGHPWPNCWTRPSPTLAPCRRKSEAAATGGMTAMETAILPSPMGRPALRHPRAARAGSPSLTPKTFDAFTLEAGYYNEQQSLLDSRAEGAVAISPLRPSPSPPSTSTFRLQATRPSVRAPHCPSPRASPYGWTVVQQHCLSPRGAPSMAWRAHPSPRRSPGATRSHQPRHQPNGPPGEGTLPGRLPWSGAQAL